MTSLARGGGIGRAVLAAWPQLALAVMVGTLIALRLAGPLRVLYAVAAVVIGLDLERRDTPRYVSFVIWLWFLSPLVRRLADLDAGWQEPSVVLLTPYLVTALSVPPLLRGLLRPERRAALRVAGVGIFALAGVGVVIIGRPEPYAVRVFGPMHSPGVFSAFLVIALVMWLARPRTPGLLAAGVAGVALLLSQVRSAWLALAIAALFVFGSLNAAQRIRMAMLAVLAVALAGPFLFTAEMRELVNNRIATMERLDDDESAVARVIGHELALAFVAEHPLGAGIGQTDPKMEQYISMRDSVVAASLVQFGLFGTVLYVAALCGLASLLWTYYRRAASVQGAALASAGLGLLATAWFSVVTAGPIGVCVWMIAGLAIRDRDVRRRPVRARSRRPWPVWVVPEPAAG